MCTHFSYNHYYTVKGEGIRILRYFAKTASPVIPPFVMVRSRHGKYRNILGRCVPHFGVIDPDFFIDDEEISV